LGNDNNFYFLEKILMGITYGSVVEGEKNSGSRAEYLAMPPVFLFG